MTDIRSALNATLRKVAGEILPPGHPVRDRLSAAWDFVLRQTGDFVSVPVAGLTIRLGAESRHLDPNYESEALGLWLKLLAPGAVAWDVGANFGLYSVLAGLAVGPGGSVTGWEPNPAAADLVARHLSANGLTGWCAVRAAAVADRPGELPFSVSSTSTSDPSSRIGAGKHDTTVTVPVEVLDAALATLRPPSVVKIDIEGAELLALRGAAALFGPGGPRPVLLLAVHPMFLSEFGVDPRELADWAEGVGYLSFDHHGTAAAPTGYAEYLLIPAEKVTAVRAAVGWPAA